MTVACRPCPDLAAEPLDLSAPRHSTRKDLLSLSSDHPGLMPTGLPDLSIQRDQHCLARLGFRVDQPEPDHWVLRPGGRPLPELHLYGAGELARFTRHHANRYADCPQEDTLT